MGLITRLFDTSGFVPRRECGAWSDQQVLLHNVSDGLIWLAYVSIPVALAYFARRRRDLPFPWVFWLFGAFIVSCGLTHLLEVVIFYAPVYRLSGAVKLVTAVVSWSAVIALVRIAPAAMSLRGPADLEREVAARTAELRQARATAEHHLAQLRAVVTHMADGLVIADGQGNLVDWSPAALRMHGYQSVEEVRRRLSEFEHVFTLSSPDGDAAPLPLAQWPMARALRGEEVRDLELVVRRRDTGLELTIRYSGTLISGPGEGEKLAFLTLHDVTHQRRAEAELRRTAELLRGVVDGSGDAIFAKDRGGRYLLCNPSAGQVFGRPPSEVVGLRDDDLLGESDARGVAAVDRQVLQSGRVQVVEEELQVACGQRRVYQTTKGPLRDERGEVVGVVGVARDVTERRRVEDELRLWADAFRHCAHGIAIGSPRSATIQVCNPAAARMLGRRPEELTGSPILSVYAPGEHERVRALIAEADRLGQVTYEARWVHADGQHFPVQMDLVSVRDEQGEVRYRVATAQDITERKRSEELLRQAHDRFARTAAVSPGVLFSLQRWPDGRGAFPYASPGVVTLFGVGPEELKADAAAAFGRAHPDDAGAVESAVAESAATMTPCHFAFRVRHPLRGQIWVEGRAAPTREPDGSVLWHGVFTDVTEQRALEDQLRQAQKMEAIGRLAGGVAHDFNNMLVVINGHSEMLLNDLPEHDERRLQVEAILEAGQKAALLTRQLLAFSRRAVVEPRVLDLNGVVRGAENLIRRLIGEDVILRVAAGEGVPAVRADAAQLDQVLLNLCVNARDAMPGGGRLAIGTSARELGEADCLLRAEARPGLYAVLTVSDTGEGIPAEAQVRIWEPFYTTKGPGKGTGLGLAVVHGVVRQSGGFVEVESEPGEGTTFRVLLPAAEAQPERGPEGCWQAPHRGRGELVLVVEDDPAVRALTTQALERAGFLVVSAADGAEALRLAEHSPARLDMLVTDVVLPGMNGPELAAELQRRQPSLRVLFCSGYTDGLLGSDAAFLAKPFTLQGLASKVCELLEAPPAAHRPNGGGGGGGDGGEVACG